MAIDPKHFTDAVHGGVKPEPITGAIMPPVFQTSTYVQKAPGEHSGYEYSRGENPTRDAYEQALARLERARFGLSFSSGLAAEQAIVQTLEPGSRVLVCDDVYGGTGRLFRKLFARYNIDFQFIDMTDKAQVDKAVAAGNPQMIWVETPTNPTIKIIDIAAMADLASACKAKLVVDNTFASPIFQQPLELGAAVVVHSTTKYIGGHSDLVGGAVMTSDDELYEKLKFIQYAAGSVPSPMDCYLFHRSIKTLAVRMRQHEENAMAVASFLSEHKKAAKVMYPGLSHHPGHDIAQKQMRGFSGMVSFSHAGSYDDVVQFFQKLKVVSLAESLGGIESLANHPEKMTHASVPEDLRRKLGIGPQLIRLSIGIEHKDDIIKDLDQALG